jgi:hypothetical protein
MSATATRYCIPEAWPRACELIELLKPACTRIWFAGSLRRGFWREPETASPRAAINYSPAVSIGDIEIVCVPQFAAPDGQLFDDGLRESRLDGHVRHLCDTGGTYLSFSIGERKADGPRHKRLRYRGIPIDLWIVIPPAEWGPIFTLRTGPQEWSKAIVTRKEYGGLCPERMQFKSGQLLYDGNPQPCPEESDVFAKLGIPYHEPHKRTPAALARLLGPRRFGQR